MNKVTLIGRLCRNLALKQTQNGTNYVNYTVAVNRRKGTEEETSFIDCVAFGKSAELMDRFLVKGDMVGVSGHLETSDYTDKNGVRRFTTKVITEDIDFLSRKREQIDYAEVVHDDELPWSNEE